MCENRIRLLKKKKRTSQGKTKQLKSAVSISSVCSCCLSAECCVFGICHYSLGISICLSCRVTHPDSHWNTEAARQGVKPRGDSLGTMPCTSHKNAQRVKSWKLQKVTHKHKHCIHSHSISIFFFFPFFLVALTVPVFPGVLAAAGAEGKRGSRDVQILDQVTEPVHDSEGHLPTLPQKLVQGHECWLSLSNPQTKPVIRRETPPTPPYPQCTCLQGSAAHSNKPRAAKHGKGPLCCDVAGQTESR